MTNRGMYDATHAGVPSLPRDGQIYAWYDTGTPDIDWTPADRAAIPHGAALVMIDQGFSGSPNLAAHIRDCENGAWSLGKAVNRAGWDVPRPTLYLGFPDTAAAAWIAGWRGDVWLALPSATPPARPPQVPAGLTVVAIQWRFAGPFDESVVFDPWWPQKAPEPPGGTMTVIPALAGKSAGDAHNELVEAGLIPIADPDQKATDTVTATEPAAGTDVAAGTRVLIVAERPVEQIT